MQKVLDAALFDFVLPSKYEKKSRAPRIGAMVMRPLLFFSGEHLYSRINEPASLYWKVPPTRNTASQQAPYQSKGLQLAVLPVTLSMMALCVAESVGSKSSIRKEAERLALTL